MEDPRLTTLERLRAGLESGDIDSVAALYTEDGAIDRRQSNAPWRGVVRGKEEIRSDLRDFHSQLADIGGVSWSLGRIGTAGNYLVAETSIAGEGPASGLPLSATAAWVNAFEGDRIRESVLYQSFEEALLAGRRRALDEARLYFVCDARPNGQDPGPLLEAAIRGGVEMIQLREKAPRCGEELVAYAEPFARVAREHGVLFWLNDEPGLVEACGADGVHVGQDDVPVAAARADAGRSALVGLSTHSPEQFDAALAASGAGRADQISVGPVWETPTKEGRPAAGLGAVEHAAASAADLPWFAIGGIDEDGVDEVVAGGAKRIVVVRAIRDADDPEAAARRLRAALDP